MNRVLCGIALFSLLWSPAAPAAAEPTTYAGGLDIGALMTEAGRVWNFADQDAVILLESARFSWLADGRVREERHRVVWISTDHTLDAFADLRVPWDSDHQTLTVNTLRVWRDRRWIDARPTAVVETTPSAFRTAPDYTGIRETMLLHDGVELPCILECDYVIEDQAPWRTGMEGQWIFNRDEPALISQLVLEAPAQTRLAVTVPEGATEADAESGLGLAARSYRMKNVAPAPSPAGDDPAAYLPHVQWSTYPGWESLGEAVSEGFTTGLRLDQALRDSLQVLLRDAYSDLDRARTITDFVARCQRRIDYDASFFHHRVRRADRVFDTGYGVDTDLAILAGALLREAGFEASPAFVGRGYGAVDEGVATFARFGAPGLWVRKDGLEAYYTPAGGLHPGLSPAVGRTLWVPGGGRLPRTWGAQEGPHRVVAGMDLRYNAEDKQWTGRGYYEARGALSAYDALEGTDGAQKRLARAVSGVVDGATVDGFSPVEFTPAAVSAHLEITAPGAERDNLGRLPVIMGGPAAGLLDALPPDVALYLAERASPIRMAGAMEQTVTLTLHLAGLDVVRLPEPVRLENAAGGFQLDVVRDGDRVTITRRLTLAKDTYAAAEWPDLRALLLAETYDSNRTLLFK